MRTTRRTVAVVGAMVAVAASTLMGVAATAASAATPGRCLENVNVRAEPSIDSRIVAVCEAGTVVQTERLRDGFVRLTDLRGWASAEYIQIDGAPAGPSRPGGSPSAPAGSDDTDAPSTTPGSRDERPGDDADEPAAGRPGQDDADEPEDADAPAGDEPAAPPIGPLGGLL